MSKVHTLIHLYKTVFSEAASVDKLENLVSLIVLTNW